MFENGGKELIVGVLVESDIVGKVIELKMVDNGVKQLLGKVVLESGIVGRVIGLAVTKQGYVSIFLFLIFALLVEFEGFKLELIKEFCQKLFLILKI